MLGTPRGAPALLGLPILTQHCLLLSVNWRLRVTPGSYPIGMPSLLREGDRRCLSSPSVTCGWGG